MASPLTFTSLQTELLAIIARVPYPFTVPDGAFSVLYPTAIQYAENRIYTEIPMLSQRRQDTQLVTADGVREIDLAGTSQPCVVPERVSLVVNGATVATGEQVQAVPTSLDFIDMWWPIQRRTATPTLLEPYRLFWAIKGGTSSVDHQSTTIVLAPTPDAAYPVVLTGLFQPIPLSGANPQTYLSTVYPALLTAACMVYLSGALLRNYSASGIPGTQSPDEPGQPVYWEGQFKTLQAAALKQELRIRVEGSVPYNGLPTPPISNAPPSKG